jgi:hypothetical protein
MPSSFQSNKKILDECLEFNIPIDRYLVCPVEVNTTGKGAGGKSINKNGQTVVSKLLGRLKDGEVFSLAIINNSASEQKNKPIIETENFSLSTKNISLCGIILPSLENRTVSDGIPSFDIALLPYNFNVLLPLIRQGKQIIDSSDNLLALNKNKSVWRNSFLKYWQNTPDYYHQNIYILLQQNDLVSLSTITLPTPYNRQTNKTAYKLEQNAITDLICLESAASYNRFNQLINPIQNIPLPILATLSTPDLFSLTIPTSLNQIHSNDLLSTWELMRKQIYGGEFIVSSLFP